VSDGNQGPAFLPLATAVIDVWSRRKGENDEAARAWQIPAATAETDRPGVLDVVGYRSTAVLGDSSVENAASSANVDVDLVSARAEADSPSPSGSWLTVPTLPGFQFQAVLGGQPLVSASSCPKLTICLARNANDAPEIVVRVLPTQANGKRWAVLGKFASDSAGVWVQQIGSAQVKYYELIERGADSPELPGLVDRAAFAP